MSKPRIILVEPAGAINVGSIARVMKNMQLEELILVNPQCDRDSDEARRMAVHGIDVLEKARIVSSLPEALQGCQKAIATTARSRSIPTTLESPKEALPWLLTENVNSALIFGPEERGLSNIELNYAQRFVCIPANPAYPSLNLAQAVAICSYELYQADCDRSLDTSESYVKLPKEENNDSSVTAQKQANLDTLEQYYQHLEQVLLEIGYLYPHTTPAKMEKFRRLYNKANLSEREVAMLRGILRQVMWAINR
ncbi:MAG: RNA methyltransferase [Xenococcaceae cyanobacterium]